MNKAHKDDVRKLKVGLNKDLLSLSRHHKKKHELKKKKHHHKKHHYHDNDKKN